MSTEERGATCGYGIVVRVMRALVPRPAQEPTSSATCIATVASGRATRVCEGRLSVHYRDTATGLTAIFVLAHTAFFLLPDDIRGLREFPKA